MLTFLLCSASARLGARTQSPQGGSAGLLGAFVSLVKTGGLEYPLHCVLCIAENSVSTLATRPDDVHTFYSGRTVEVNNTDAEGRRESRAPSADCAERCAAD